ncbi:MAG: hypothetical protein ACYCUV_10560, partial [Phycisphaerae bacterium]
MKATDEQTIRNKGHAWGQRAGLVAIIGFVGAGWLAYFVITGLVIPASQVAAEKGKIAGAKQHYTSDLAKLKAEELTVRQQEQRSLAAEQAKIQSLRDKGAAYNANIRRQKQRLLAKEAAAVQALHQDNAATIKAIDRMATFAQGLPKSLRLEQRAAGRLVTILQEDAQIETNSEPLIRKVLAGNFALKHTGARSLAAALSLETGVLARETDSVSKADVSHLDIRTLVVAHHAVSAADKSLQAAVAQSTQVMADVKGSVVMTGVDGMPLPLGGVRVILIPRRISRERMLRILNTQKQYLSRLLSRYRLAVNQLNGNLGWTFPVIPARTGQCIGYA